MVIQVPKKTELHPLSAAAECSLPRLCRCWHLLPTGVPYREPSAVVVMATVANVPAEAVAAAAVRVQHGLGCALEPGATMGL